MPEDEYLLIGSALPSDEEFSHGELGHCSVVQVVGKHVAVVRGGAETIRLIGGNPQLEVATHDTRVSPEMMARLTAAEALFVKAWQGGREKKARPGDKLDWDAKGYEAP